MSPSAFVGIPDWLSAVVAAAFALPWLILLGRGRLRSPWLWVAAAVAAGVFPFSIAWVQVPIQQAIGQLLVAVLDMPTIQRYVLLVGIPTIAVSGLVQESVKLVVAIGALWAMRRWMAGRKPSARDGLAMGAAAGAGYGGMEAFWVFNQIFSLGWSWATVQLTGLPAFIGFIERFFTVPFHIGDAALAGYGYATGRPWRFWLLAAGLHALLNYGVLLMQTGMLSATTLEIWVAVGSVAVIVAALWLRRSSRPSVADAAA